MHKCLFLLGIIPSIASAQRISVGAVAGTNLTDDVRSGSDTRGVVSTGPSTTAFIVEPGARRLILGIKLEVNLSRGWSVEFDALHREIKSLTRQVFTPPILLPNGTQLAFIGPFTQILTPWEFPVLAKYRFALPHLKPFLLVGPSFRPASVGTNLSHIGFTTGAGVELMNHGFRISPVLRYTRWAPRYGDRVGSPLLNQVEFVVGIDRPSTRFSSQIMGRSLSAGVILGLGLGSDFKAADKLYQVLIPESNSGIYGVLLEAALAKNFAVEVDGLYRPLHGSQQEFRQSVRFAHLTWEFPVLLKYRLPGSARWQPFVTGGPSFRAEGNLNLQSVSHFGATIGGGVETRVSRLKIAPTARYTHWAGNPSDKLGHTRANQMQLLVSLTF